MVTRGELTAGHARKLNTADDPLADAREIIAGNLSVREAAQLSQKGAAPKRTSETKPARDADTVALEKELSDVLGMGVGIAHSSKGGKVEIRYKTLEQLDALLAKLRY